METDFAPQVMFEIFGIPVTETVTTTWGIMAVMVIVSYIVTRNLEKIPTGFQNFMELLYDGIIWLVDSTMGKNGRPYMAYIGTLTIYLTIANLMGLISIRPPTSDLNVPLSLALLTFILVHASGVKTKGLGRYLKSFAEPIPFLLPLNIISELSQPVSLGFRLFGNMVAAFIIMFLLYSFAPIIIPIIPHMYFDIFAGILQSFIFVMLTMTYVSIAME